MRDDLCEWESDSNPDREMEIMYKLMRETRAKEEEWRERKKRSEEEKQKNDIYA